MPRIKSAIKRVDIAERNRQRNRSWKSTVRTVRNKVEDALDAADGATAATSLKEAYSIIDRAVVKGILHKNSAARKKSALAKKLAHMAPKPAAPVKKSRSRKAS